VDIEHEEDTDEEHTEVQGSTSAAVCVLALGDV